MPSLFDELFNGKVAFEEVEGHFACERCPEWMTQAKYNVENKLLTWKCKCGHVSKIVMDLEDE